MFARAVIECRMACSAKDWGCERPTDDSGLHGIHVNFNLKEESELHDRVVEKAFRRASAIENAHDSRRIFCCADSDEDCLKTAPGAPDGPWLP